MKIQELKKSRKLLSAMISVLDNDLNDLTKAAMPSILHHGLNNLPDDVLAEILKNVVYNSEECYNTLSARNLQLVSRRFRAIILAHWEFWSFVTTAVTRVSSLKQQVSLHASTPLDFMLSLNSRTSPFIDLILQSSHRARTLCLQGSAEGVVLGETLFPSLKKVTLRLWNPGKLFTVWDFSNVTELDIMHLIPPPGSFPSLIICKLRTMKDWTAPITRFLVSVPSLETLNLCLDFPLQVSPIGADNPEEISLPKLKHLVLSMSNGEIGIFSFGCLISKLRTRVLEHVEITFRLDIWNSYDRSWFSTLFSNGAKHLWTTHLKLDIEQSDEINSPPGLIPLDAPFSDIFTTFPNLQSIQLRLGDIDLESSWSFDSAAKWPMYLSTFHIQLHRRKRVGHWDRLLTRLEEEGIILSKLTIDDHNPSEKDESQLRTNLMDFHPSTDIIFA